MTSGTIVLKFDSSIRRFLTAAVQEIYQWHRAGWRVLVISAGTAENILEERHGARLLAGVLDSAGIPARIVDPLEIGLSAPEGAPMQVNQELLDQLLGAGSIVVTPGSFGCGPDGRVQLFERGGADLSAVFLAWAVRAHRCRFLTDVDGLHEPEAVPGEQPRRYVALSYAKAQEVAATSINPKAIRFLQQHRASVELAVATVAGEAVIGPFDCESTQLQAAPASSVLLLGLGTVGLGVYQRLREMPDQFRVVGALVRDRAKHVAGGIAEELLHGPGNDLTGLVADIVVDSLPEFDPSCSLVEGFLRRGISVVSSNKALIAQAGPTLATLGARNSASLLYSAAVGGSAPMIEALRREIRRDDIRSIAAVLNAPSSHVLDRCAEGLLLNEAKRVAHEYGLADAEPAEDLCGHDIACKLRILVRHAFGQELNGVAVEPVSAAAILRCRATTHGRATLRFVARAWKLGEKVLGQVRLEAIAANDPLAPTRDDWNRLVITRANGENVVISGRGSGRRPTTLAVLADLLELRFAQAGRSGRQAMPRNVIRVSHWPQRVSL